MCVFSRYLKIVIRKILKNYKLLRIINYFENSTQIANFIKFLCIFLIERKIIFITYDILYFIFISQVEKLIESVSIYI